MDIKIVVINIWYLNIDKVTKSNQIIWILLIVENWKHCNKIIFKYVNNAVEFSFKVIFTEKKKKNTCRSYEQCIVPTQKKNANTQHS